MTTKLLGIDYGTKNVGFSIGNSLTKTSANFFSFSYKEKIDLLQKISDICEEWDINKIVFGMPYNQDGSKNKMCREIEKFSKKIKTQKKVDVYLHDENFTSMEFKIEQKNNNIGDLDDSHGYAAKLILESFMREQL